MAGTLTVGREPMKIYGNIYGEIITVSWTSDSSGNADVTVPNMNGFIVSAKTTPSGSAAPTANYDIKLKDSAGFDVLGSVLNDRSASAVERIPAANSGVVAVAHLHGTYTFDVTNAGNAKAGTCVFRLIF